jgi:hypothetical protein
MHTGPLVDALIEHPVDDLGHYALENGFHVVVESAVPAGADPRARGGLQPGCEWIKKGQPLCLIGDSGTGKSHMLIAWGTEAAMKGYRVRYTLATKLVNELV